MSDPRQQLEFFVKVKKGLVKQTSLNLDKLCFPKQLAFIKDPALFATAVTSRRAGKTTACALHLLHTALTHPNTHSFYITYARTDAKGIVWPMLHQLDWELKLGGEFNESELLYKATNGSVIRLGGAATPEEINRYRGYSIKLAYVDEAQRFGGYLERLVNDVLVYACADLRGQIRLIGTPGLAPVGYFHSVAEDRLFADKWSRHRWTIFDNPFFETKRGESPSTLLSQEIERRNVSENDPTIQREFFGAWVHDKKNLVLDYDSTCNDYIELPKAKYNYIMGIDLGFKDADAIAILAHSDSSPTTYLVDELITHKQGLTELFKQVEDLRFQYQPYKLVIDTGGLGLKVAEEMRRRYRIPVQPAEKKRKFENYELLNDCLRTKRFMAKKDSRFAIDAMLLEWDQDKMQPDKKVVSDRFHSDIVDAVLYAFRESPAYSYQPPIIQPKYGTKEWADKEVIEMERHAEKRFAEREMADKEEAWEWI